MTQDIDNSPMLRRVIQAVADLAGRPLDGLRALDLACAHGSYAMELAALGAHALGIEGASPGASYRADHEMPLLPEAGEAVQPAAQ